MGEISLSDIAALLGNRNDNGFGGDNGALWLIIILVLFGGWGRGWGNNGNGGGAGSAGGNELYPWLAQQQNVSDGFRDQSLMTSINGIQQSLCNGFNQTQVNMLQGFNATQAQTAQLAANVSLGMANQTATILSEHCADRQALSDGIQKVLDKLCDQELQAAQRENANLRQQLAMADLAASQQAQNTFISQGFANEVDALYNRLNNCPVPSMPVYGRTPIFTCQSQNTGCGCGLA